MSRVAAVLLIAMLALLLAASAAVADPPPTQITFDDLAPNTVVTDQYAAQGVHFAHPYAFGITRAGVPAPGSVNGSCTGGSGSPGILTVEASGGITGQSGFLGCGSNEFSNGYDEAIAFDYWRHGVGLNVLARPWVGDVGAPQPLTVRLLDRDGAVLEQHDYSLASGQVVPLAYSRPQSDIAYVELSGDGRLWLDDLSAPVDAVPPPPAYRIALTSPTLALVEGTTGTVPVKVIRFNGSTGPVGLSVADLPAGILAAAVDPNPLGGTAPGVLRVTADTPAGGDRQLTLSPTSGAPASAGTTTSGSIALDVSISPALTMDRATVDAVPGCGANGTSFTVGVHGDYHGVVHVTTAVLSGPATVAAQPYVTAVGDGALQVPISVSTSSAASSPTMVQVTLTPDGATPVTGTLAIYADPFRIDGVDYSAIAERRLSPPQQQIVRGAFPSECAVRWLDDAGNELPVQGTVSGAPGQSDGLRLGLGLDPVATSIRAISVRTGAELGRTQRIPVFGFRNGPALSGSNSGAGANMASYDWNDFVSTFGTDDAEDCFLDVTCWRDPLAIKYYNRFSANVTSAAGLCWGWSQVAIGFASGDDLARVYTPGATRGYDIAPLTDGTEIKRQIGIWQVRWNDRANLIDYLNQQANPPTAAALRARLEALIQRGVTPGVTVWNKPAGHAVVAYDVRGTADGGFDIVTYNPNIPYTAAEETSSAARSNALTGSIIHVTPGGIWSGGIPGWSGTLATLQVFDGRPAVNATLPTDLPAIGSAGGPTSAVDTAQIAVGGRGALRGDGSVRPGLGVTDDSTPTGGAPEPLYGLTPGRGYTLTLRGTRAGSYTQSLLGGNGAASVSGARTAPGQRDTLTVTPGAPKLAFASAGKAAGATLSLVSRVPRASGAAVAAAASDAHPTRTADVALTAGGGRGDALAFDRGDGTLTLRHTGAATSAAVTLGSSGEGTTPTSVALAPMRLGAGQRLELKPTSWSDPLAGVGYTLRDARGAVVRRGHARIRATTRVKLARGLKVIARRRPHGRGRVTVSGRVLKAGRAPLLAVAVQAVRSGKVVARGVLVRRGTAKVRAGRFSLPLTLRRLPRGTVVRVTATLSDEAAGYAATRVSGRAAVR